MAHAKVKYEIQDCLTSTRDDDHEACFSVRRYGKIFYITIQPLRFINSPRTTEMYMTYLALPKSGEDEADDLFVEDVYQWVMNPFEALFAELAPPIEDARIQITLKDWLWPEWYHFYLDFLDETPVPQRDQSQGPPRSATGLALTNDLLDELETWTTFYDPANLIINNETVLEKDPLFKPPKTVFLTRSRTECFFKQSWSGKQAKREFEIYKKLQAPDVTSKFNVCHLHGLVMDDAGYIMGLLLTSVDSGKPDGRAQTLLERVDPDNLEDPPMEIRKRLWTQIDGTVKALHDMGIVWGDVKPDNVLVDKDDNAYIIDFGGGYTEGWVERDNHETLKGDLSGMEKLEKYMFSGVWYVKPLDDVVLGAQDKMGASP